MAEKEDVGTLKGTSLDIYRFLLKANKPVGIREIQRALHLSSPSVAQHHLARLENAGLIRREWGDYVINRVVLDNCVKISRFLIPRYFFYLLFAAAVLAIELTVLRPNVLYESYVFSVIATIIFIVIFGYETIKIWRKGNL